MSDTKQFKLVDGVFNIEDASDILLHLLDKKINFHLCKMLQTFERSGIEDPYSQKRVKELRATRVSLLETLELAKLTGKNLEVQSDIQIALSTQAITTTSTELKETV